MIRRYSVRKHRWLVDLPVFWVVNEPEIKAVWAFTVKTEYFYKLLRYFLKEYFRRKTCHDHKNQNYNKARFQILMLSFLKREIPRFFLPHQMQFRCLVLKYKIWSGKHFYIHVNFKTILWLSNARNYYVRRSDENFHVRSEKERCESQKI